MVLPINSTGFNEIDSATTNSLAKATEIKNLETEPNIKPKQKRDTVTISEEGRALSEQKVKSDVDDEQNAKGSDNKSESSDKSSEAAGEKSSGSSAIDELIEKIKQRIKEVKQDISQLNSSQMPEETKENLLKAKYQELTQLSGQLLKAMEAKQKAR